MSESSEAPIVKNSEQSRFEMNLDGSLAVLNYRESGDRIVMVHTEVPQALGGRGLGGKLAAHALDYARENNLRVILRCPFVTSYVERHPEYKDLIVEA